MKVIKSNYHYLECVLFMWIRMIIGLSLITGFPCPCSFGALWRQNMCRANLCCYYRTHMYTAQQWKRIYFFSNPKKMHKRLLNNRLTFLMSSAQLQALISPFPALRRWVSVERRVNTGPSWAETIKNPFTCHCCNTGYCNVWELDNLGYVVKVKWSVINSISVWPVKLRMGFWLPSDASGLSAAERLEEQKHFSINTQYTQTEDADMHHETCWLSAWLNASLTWTPRSLHSCYPLQGTGRRERNSGRTRTYAATGERESVTVNDSLLWKKYD